MLGVWLSGGAARTPPGEPKPLAGCGRLARGLVGQGLELHERHQVSEGEADVLDV